MREKREIQKDIDDVNIALRTLLEDVNDITKPFDKEKVAAERAALTEKRAALCKELADAEAARVAAQANDAPAERSALYNADEWIKAAKEERSLTIGTIGSPGIGSVNQLSALYKEVSDGDEILKQATYFYGRDASTNIPVISPMDEPDSYSEGAANVSKDTTASTTNKRYTVKDPGTSIDITEIQPCAYSAIIPLTAEGMVMGSVDFESQINGLFAKAFTRKMHNGMLTGAGTGKLMRGIYTSAKDTTAASAKTKIAAGGKAVKISELAGLALSVIGKSEKYTLLMNSTIYQALLGDSSTGEDVKIYKESLIRDKSIEGVSIFIDNLLTTGSAEGDPLVIAVPLSRYAIGVAQQIVIDPIKVLGDTKTYFQATMFFSGKQISDKDIYSLTMKSAT